MNPEIFLTGYWCKFSWVKKLNVASTVLLKAHDLIQTYLLSFQSGKNYNLWNGIIYVMYSIGGNETNNFSTSLLSVLFFAGRSVLSEVMLQCPPSRLLDDTIISFLVFFKTKGLIIRDKSQTFFITFLLAIYSSCRRTLKSEWLG